MIAGVLKRGSSTWISLCHHGVPAAAPFLYGAGREAARRCQSVFGDLDLLRARDVYKFCASADRPRTAAYEEVKAANAPVTARFLEWLATVHLSRDEDAQAVEHVLTGAAMWDLFKRFILETRSRGGADWSQTFFGTEIGRLAGGKDGRFLGDGAPISKARQKKGVEYTLTAEGIVGFLEARGWLTGAF